MVVGSKGPLPTPPGPLQSTSVWGIYIYIYTHRALPLLCSLPLLCTSNSRVNRDRSSHLHTCLQLYRKLRHARSSSCPLTAGPKHTLPELSQTLRSGPLRGGAQPSTNLLHSTQELSLLKTRHAPGLRSRAGAPASTGSRWGPRFYFSGWLGLHERLRSLPATRSMGRSPVLRRINGVPDCLVDMLAFITHDLYGVIVGTEGNPAEQLGGMPDGKPGRVKQPALSLSLSLSLVISPSHVYIGAGLG